jgi:hypothetical protein
MRVESDASLGCPESRRKPRVDVMFPIFIAVRTVPSLQPFEIVRVHIPLLNRYSFSTDVFTIEDDLKLLNCFAKTGQVDLGP